MERSKRLYVVRDAESESGGAFVAESVAEAKKMALREDIAEDWIQLRVTTKKIDVSTWAKGLADYKRCLREGVFGSVEETCDECKQDRRLSCVLKDSRCLCDDCYEKLSEATE